MRCLHLSPLPSEDLFRACQWEFPGNCCCGRTVKLSDITALLHLPTSPSSHSDAGEQLLFLREEGLVLH